MGGGMEGSLDSADLTRDDRGRSDCRAPTKVARNDNTRYIDELGMTPLGLEQ